MGDAGYEATIDVGVIASGMTRASALTNSSGATAATMIASVTSRHTSAPMPRVSSKPASRDSAGRVVNFSTGGPGQRKRRHGETGVRSTWSSSEPVPCQDAETASLRRVSAEEDAVKICQQICEERNLQWESDPELRKLASAKFPSALLREDVDKAKAEDTSGRQIDPNTKALVIIAAGPPCPDYSRVCENACENM